jgi:hypothetical protein
MKNGSLITVAIKEIHPDFFFCFSSDTESPDLEASIACSGIRTPVHLVSRAEGFRLCSGFRRFRAASSLGLETIPAEVIAESDLPAAWFREILLEHLSIRHMNLVEKARALHILQSFESMASADFTIFMDLMHLPNHPDLVFDMLRILYLHPDAIHYSERFDLPLKAIKQFFGYTVDEQKLLSNLAMDLSLRPVELFEMASGLKEAAIRLNKTLSRIYGDLDLAAVVSESERTRNEKIGRIKDILHRTRFPLLSSVNERLQRIREETGLPSPVRLSWDQTLEIPGVRMQAEIRSLKDLHLMVQWFANPEKIRRFEALFRFI